MAMRLPQGQAESAQRWSGTPGMRSLQLAEIAVPRSLFATILTRIQGLALAPG
jgi:hypothetical protein